MGQDAAKPGRISTPTVVLILLCLMYLINYMVRVNVSTAAAVFKQDLGLSNTQVGLIFSAFAYPYLLFQVIGGWVSDRFGARLALTVFAVIWSVATMLMGLVHSLEGMLLGRVMLGLGVSALPTATRAMASWMPKERRGFAQGITHSSARLGNALTPPIVAWLISLVTWRGSYVVLGGISLLWAIAWAWYFRDDPAQHPGVKQHELVRLSNAAAQAETRRRHVPLGPLARRMLLVTIVYFCYGWTLWLFLAWIPQFFLHSYRLDLNHSALFAASVFMGGVLGDVLGGLASDRVFERTGDRKKARRNLVMAGFACSFLFMLPIWFAHSLTVAAICLSVAFFFAEFTVGPMWAIPMDIAPHYSGFASGFMNSGSALAAIVSPWIAGYVIDQTGNWELPFVGSMALLLAGSILALWMKTDEMPTPSEVSPKSAIEGATI